MENTEENARGGPRGGGGGGTQPEGIATCLSWCHIDNQALFSFLKAGYAAVEAEFAEAKGTDTLQQEGHEAILR